MQNMPVGGAHEQGGLRGVAAQRKMAEQRGVVRGMWAFACSIALVGTVLGCGPATPSSPETGSKTSSTDPSSASSLSSDPSSSVPNATDGPVSPSVSEQMPGLGVDGLGASNGVDSQSSTSTPASSKDAGVDWSVWPDNVTLSARLVDVVLPPALTALYPAHVTSQLVPQAATVVAISQGGLPGLYTRRGGNEHSYYQPVRPYVTPQLWSDLDHYISRGVRGESHEIGSFAPQTTRDGVWARIGGITYLTTGSNSVRMYGIPRVTVEEGNVLVSFELEVTGKARPASVRYQATYTAVMEFSQGAWRMNGWRNLVTSDIEVVRDGAVND